MGHAIAYFWKSFIDSYYTDLYSTIGSSEEWFCVCVCAVILNTKSRLGKSVNSFNSLSIDQQEVLRKHIVTETTVWEAFINFPKYYLEIYLICLRQPQIRIKCWAQWLCWLARYKLNSVMVPLETTLLAILAIVLQIDLIVGEVVVIVTRIVLPCHWKISVPH